MFSLPFLVLAMLLVSVKGDYQCLCNYEVELPVVADPTGAGQPIGYMYEFDCKPIYTPFTANTVYQSIQFETKIGYVQMSSSTLIQTCQGSPNAGDRVPSPAPTTTMQPPPTSPSVPTSTVSSSVIPSNTLSTTLSSSSSASVVPSVNYSTTATQQSTISPTLDSSPSTSIDMLSSTVTSIQTALYSQQQNSTTNASNLPESTTQPIPSVSMSYTTQPITSNLITTRKPSISTPSTAATAKLTSISTTAKPIVASASTSTTATTRTISMTAAPTTTFTTSTPTTTTSTTTTPTTTTSTTTTPTTTTTHTTTTPTTTTSTTRATTTTTTTTVPPSTTRTPVVCPNGWNLFRGSCYLFHVDNRWDWEHSNTYCGIHHAHLAFIETKDEDDFIGNELRHRIDTDDDDDSDTGVWIGGSDDDREGHWMWKDMMGHLLDIHYTNWHHGEPDSGDGDHGEDCMCLIGDKGFEWQDYSCHKHMYFVCEKSLYLGAGQSLIG